MFTYENTFILMHGLITFCQYICQSRILSPRKWAKPAILYCIPFIVVSLIYEKWTGDVRSSVRYYIYLFSVLLPVFVLYKNSIFYKIGASCFTIFYAMFSESFLGNILWPILTTLFHFPYNPSTVVPHENVTALCIYLFPVTILECLALLLGHRVWDYLHLNFNLKILCEIVVCPFIFSSGMLVLLDLNSPIIFIGSMLFLTLSNLLFINGICDLIENMKAARNNQIMEKKLELLLSRYESMDKQNLSTRLQNHDIANHLRTIEYLISDDQIAQATNYLNKIIFSQTEYK